MANKRKSRWITDSERDYILSLSSRDCLKTSIFMDCFGEFNGKRKFNTYDVMKVPKGTYHNNKNEFVTTVGAWFFNKACIDYPGIFDEIDSFVAIIFIIENRYYSITLQFLHPII